MEQLKSKLHSEIARREVFERKNAELEAVNDKLRLENEKLLTDIEEIRKQLSSNAYHSHPQDDSDQSDSSDDDSELASPDQSTVIGGSNLKKENEAKPATCANLINNTNYSNGNSNSEVKIQTLRRKQKALKAELHRTMNKTMGFQEAFQSELDLRTKTEEKLDNLRVRYDRLVLENENLRAVLTNHCIDVPPHQPITSRQGRQSKNSSQHPHHSRPPTFVPPGRTRTPLSDRVPNSSSDHSMSSSQSSLCVLEGTQSLDGPKSENEQSHDDFSKNTSVLDQHTMDLLSSDSDAEFNTRNNDIECPTDAQLKGRNSDEDVGIEHIVIGERLATPTSATPTTSATQEIDVILNTTTDQIANAKAFYDLVRNRIKSEADAD